MVGVTLFRVNHIARYQPAIDAGLVGVRNDQTGVLPDVSDDLLIRGVERLEPAQDRVSLGIRHAGTLGVLVVLFFKDVAVPLLGMSRVEVRFSNGHLAAAVLLNGTLDKALLPSSRCGRALELVDPLRRNIQLLHQGDHGFVQVFGVLLDQCPGFTGHDFFLKVGIHRINDVHAFCRQLLDHATDWQHAVLEATKNAINKLPRPTLIKAIAAKLQTLCDGVCGAGVHQGRLVRLNFFPDARLHGSASRAA